MKGLLYKDLMMAAKYCRSFLLLVVVFVAVLLFEPGNLFYMVYPCLFVSMIPVSLLAYDERDKWNQFSGALPVGRGMLVSVKYLVSLLFLVVVLVMTAGACFVGLRKAGAFAAGEYLSMLGMVFSFSLLAPSVMLPFTFKLGVEKGRIAYYIVMGVGAGALGIAAYSGVDLSQELVLPEWGVGVMLGVSVAVFALSWLLSVRFYRQREL